MQIRRDSYVTALNPGFGIAESWQVIISDSFLSLDFALFYRRI